MQSLAVSCEFGTKLHISLRDKVCGFEKGPISFENAIQVAENKLATQQSFLIQTGVRIMCAATKGMTSQRVNTSATSSSRRKLSAFLSSLWETCTFPCPWTPIRKVLL